MEAEEKELLLRDLSARIAYWDILRVRYNDNDYTPFGYGAGRISLLDNPFMSFVSESPLLEEIKPYLRPLSTMTSEEFNELLGVTCGAPYDYSEHHMVVQARIADIRTKWFDKKMFDHRELIPKGLAPEAPEDMYKNETI